MKRLKFIPSADGTRLIRLRSIKAVRLKTHAGNGFVASKIVAQLRGGGEDVTLFAYTAIADTAEAQNLPSTARAEMDRLLALLNGGRLRSGESWPSAREV